MIPVALMIANAVGDDRGIKIKRIKRKIKKDKKKRYQGVNQGYQGAISPLSKFYSGHFSGYFRAYLSIVEA